MRSSDQFSKLSSTLSSGLFTYAIEKFSFQPFAVKFSSGKK